MNYLVFAKKIYVLSNNSRVISIGQIIDINMIDTFSNICTLQKYIQDEADLRTYA